MKDEELYRGDLVEVLSGGLKRRVDGSAAIIRQGTQLATLEIGSWNLTKVSGNVRFGVRLP